MFKPNHVKCVEVKILEATKERDAIAIVRLADHKRKATFSTFQVDVVRDMEGEWLPGNIQGIDAKEFTMKDSKTGKDVKFSKRYVHVLPNQDKYEAAADYGIDFKAPESVASATAVDVDGIS